MNEFSGTFQPQDPARRPWVKSAVDSLNQKREREENEAIRRTVDDRVEQKKPKINELQELYAILAETYPNGVTIQQAKQIQMYHPKQLGNFKPSFVQGAIRRHVDRKRREVAGF